MDTQENNKLKKDSDGVEEEEVIGEETIKKPYDVSLINVRNDRYSIYDVIRRIRIGEIILFPEFQRRFVWNEVQQSRLIESILLRIPLPSFYLDATNDDRWLVVDGLQRLNTLYRFMEKKELVLDKLEFLGSELNGLTYDKIPRKFQRFLETTQLSVYVITPETPPEAKFTIFKRINTGGMVLSAQEIRHCLYQGKATKLLETLTSSPEFELATCNSISRRRMSDRECALRFCAFYPDKYSEYRKPDLDNFLGNAMQSINEMNDSEIRGLENAFREAMIKVSLVFGEYAFRKVFDTSNRRNPINKALFETWSVCLQKYPIDILEKCKSIIFENFIDVMNKDKYFVDSITQGTGDVKKVHARFSTVKRIIREAIQ